MSRTELEEWAGADRRDLADRWDRDPDTVRIFDRVESTSDTAEELAEEGAPEGTVVLAREQTSGRGRQGRTWYSPRDRGLYLSLVLRPDRVENASLLPILAGLGIVRRLDGVLESLEPAVKWPNDLMAGDAKFGGVLSEASWEGERVRHLVVGAGLNVRPLGDDAPADVRSGGTSLDEATGEETSFLTVADAVVEGLEERVSRPPGALDPATLDALDRYDWLQDRRVEITTPSDEEWVIGNCVGIAPDGALLFRPDRGALRRLRSVEIRLP